MLQNIEGKYTKVLLVVEGVYSMDGDIAPVPEFVRLKNKYHTFLMVDEAHSSGVIGENGGGVDDYFHLNPTDIDIKIGDALQGWAPAAAISPGSRALVDYLKYSLPGFVFTAGISPPWRRPAKKSVEIIRRITICPPSSMRTSPIS